MLINNAREAIRTERILDSYQNYRSYKKKPTNMDAVTSASMLENNNLS